IFCKSKPAIARKRPMLIATHRFAHLNLQFFISRLSNKINLKCINFPHRNVCRHRLVRFIYGKHYKNFCFLQVWVIDYKNFCFLQVWVIDYKNVRTILEKYPPPVRDATRRWE
ncbi:hypothetical protein, partial [Fannyhessea vaginae]|uniref:hypothetical protein n=1 Tax=Fannyhessea vaginae TaxID=82135 RepID=UPI001FBB6C9F